MTFIIRPTAGTVSTYTSCGFTATDFNGLANGSIAIMPTGSAINNATNLDDYINVSFSIVNGVTTTTTASFFALYLLPLNQDGTTYGDGTVTGSTLSGASYWMTNCFVKSGITSGGTLVGSFPAVWMPRAAFILGIANNTNGTLGSSAAATVAYTTTNLNGNG